MYPSAEELLISLESAGFRGRIVPVSRLQDLRHEFEARQREYGLDPALVRDHLSTFQFTAPSGAFKTHSMIVVAAPQPAFEVVFPRKGREFPVRIPPTYIHHTDGTAERILLGVLRPGGYSLAPARVPEKMLAVRSGLARYGRNNVSYVPELGSFHRPVVFFSDIPAAEDAWHEERILDRCESCSACRRACPTAAIAEDRFLIRAERCLTFLNERPGEFPAWVDPSWHNCLVGCMRCQEVCPENRLESRRVERLGWFTGGETELLLAGGAADGRVSADTWKKLADFGLVEYKNILHRNLGVLLRERES
jgi:epoxyqueuosine reductase